MASLIPWRQQKGSPFLPIDAIQNEMNRLFSSFGRWPLMESEWTEGAWSPAIDVQEDKDNIRVVAEVPGMTKDDLNVSVQGNELCVQGEKKQEKQTKGNGFTRTERSFGSFCRTIPLPQGVDETHVEASYKNGVLELTLPKKEEAKPKQINIQVK